MRFRGVRSPWEGLENGAMSGIHKRLTKLEDTSVGVRQDCDLNEQLAEKFEDWMRMIEEALDIKERWSAQSKEDYKNDGYEFLRYTCSRECWIRRKEGIGESISAYLKKPGDGVYLDGDGKRVVCNFSWINRGEYGK